MILRIFRVMLTRVIQQEKGWRLLLIILPQDVEGGGSHVMATKMSQSTPANYNHFDS